MLPFFVNQLKLTGIGSCNSLFANVKIMHKYLYIKSVFVLIFLLISCQKEKDEEILKPAVNHFDFDLFSLSVINNTLAFESEDELNRCFDYLAALGDENFDSFEESLNYVSHRRFFYDNDEASIFDDELYSTLLNPEGKIIVGDYLLQDCPELNEILIFEIDCENSLFDNPIVPFMIVNRNQDVFRILEGEAPLKSDTEPYCDYNRQEATISDFHVDVQIKTVFNRAIIVYFKAKISRPWCSGCGLTLSVYNTSGMKSFCFLDRNGDDSSEQRICDIYLSDSSTGTSAEIYFRPGFKPTNYRFNVDYTVVQAAPYFYETYNGDISCGASDVCY